MDYISVIQCKSFLKCEAMVSRQQFGLFDGTAAEPHEHMISCKKHWMHSDALNTLSYVLFICRDIKFYLIRNISGWYDFA